MFKLAVLAALLAVAAAAPAPGGLTGIVLDHGLGPIHAPHVVAHAPVHHVAHVAHVAPVHHVAHVVHQPVAPIVHNTPIVTRTVLPSHDSHAVVHYAGHGLHGLH